jgi:hypothetical protein
MTVRKGYEIQDECERCGRKIALFETKRGSHKGCHYCPAIGRWITRVVVWDW